MDREKIDAEAGDERENGAGDAPAPAEAAAAAPEGEVGPEAPAEAPEPPEVAALRAEVARLQGDLAAARSQAEGLNSQVNELTGRLRTVSAAYKKQQDEVTATRERLQRQASAQEERRRGEVVSALFDPLENLRRSRDALQRQDTSNPGLTQGLDIVIAQFLTAFENLGMEEVPGKGARFDPSLHEAITMVPVLDPALDNVVMEVFSAGYRIGTRLIQPARVVVGSYAAPEPEPGAAAEGSDAIDVAAIEVQTPAEDVQTPAEDAGGRPVQTPAEEAPTLTGEDPSGDGSDKT